MSNINIIQLLATLLAWVVIGYIGYRIYRKQEEKAKPWKLLISFGIGLFTFSFHFQVAQEILKLPLLPLGVWLLYLLFPRKSRWPLYRPFAWLGFLAQFIFLAATVVSMGLHSVIYPTPLATTYLADVQQASLQTLHSEFPERELDLEILEAQLSELAPARFFDQDWYEHVYMHESNREKERFPYQLVGIRPGWGSGIQAVIYLEKDGQGFLVSTAKGQYYFRAEQSMLKEEVPE